MKHDSGHAKIIPACWYGILKKVLVLENKTQMPKKQKHRSCEYVGQEIDKQISPKIEISEEKDYWWPGYVDSVTGENTLLCRGSKQKTRAIKIFWWRKDSENFERLVRDLQSGLARDQKAKRACDGKICQVFGQSKSISWDAKVPHNKWKKWAKTCR